MFNLSMCSQLQQKCDAVECAGAGVLQQRHPADTGAKLFGLSRPVDAELQARLEHSRRRDAGRRARSAIVPGQAEDSLLYRLIAGLDKPSMPLGGNKLTDGQIAAIKNWIDQGVTGMPTPSQQRLSPPRLPRSRIWKRSNSLPARAITGPSSCRSSPVPAVARAFSNPIDRFLEKARQEKGLKAAPKADRLTLLRRAYMDLIGLPPTPEEIDAFMNDTAPGAWERLIDKLLASPHYGERWGRHWLDAARYADSSGYENDTDQPNMWRYRDYVIKPSMTTSPTTLL